MGNIKLRLISIISIILLATLIYFSFNAPEFYVISGIISMFGVLWVFYWVDGYFELNYKLKHYFVLIVLFSLGMLLNPFYYIWTPYDKVMHFFTPLFWCTLIFIPVKKLNVGFFFKLLFTISIFISFMVVHEIGEYGMDKIFDLHMQGVYANSFSTNLDRHNMIEVQNPWDDTMQDLVLDVSGALTFGLINAISYRYRRKELV